MTGTISLEDFNCAAQDFADVCSRCNGGWSLDRNSLQGKKFYGLVHEAVVVTKPAHATAMPEEFSDLSTGGEDDDASAVHQTNAGCVALRLEAVWSQTYSVPILFVQGSDGSGRPLKYESMWDLLTVRKGNEEFATLNQMEHPVSGRTVFALHPCRSAALMSALMSTESPNGEQSSDDASLRLRYLVLWLSTVLSVFGIALPLELLKMLR